MPWIALAPDISGVCSVEETFEITSMPTKTLRMKIVSQTTASFMPALLLRSPVPRSPRGSARARIAPSWVTQEPIDDLVLEVGGERAALVVARRVGSSG